jgi:hypothetical protein
MNLTWLFGKRYAVRFKHKGGGSRHMWTIRLQDCPRVGDRLQTAREDQSSLQWKVVEVEHLEGNCAVLYVQDAFDRF